MDWLRLSPAGEQLNTRLEGFLSAYDTYRGTLANSEAWRELKEAYHAVLDTTGTFTPESPFEEAFQEHARILAERLYTLLSLQREGRDAEASAALLGKDLIEKIHARGKAFPEKREIEVIRKGREFSSPVTMQEVQAVHKQLPRLEEILHEFFEEHGLEELRYEYARTRGCERPHECMNTVETSTRSWWDSNTGIIALSTSIFYRKGRDTILDVALAAAAHEWGHALSALAASTLPSALHIGKDHITPITLPVDEHYAMTLTRRMIAWLEEKKMIQYPLREEVEVQEAGHIRWLSIGILMLEGGRDQWFERVRDVYGPAIANQLSPFTNPYGLIDQHQAYALEALLLAKAPFVPLGSWNIFTYEATVRKLGLMEGRFGGKGGFSLIRLE